MSRDPGETVSGLRRLAARTPETRNRHVDLLRAFAISAVVIGHWLAIVVVHDDGGVHGGNALATLPWSRPLTWLFQVMPVFFLVGGYANGASLRSHRGRGGDAASWLLGRTDRLLRPTTAFLVLLAASAVLARVFGVEPELIGMATWAASIPLWFLAAYLAVVFLSPLTHALHRRAGLAVPVALAAVVGASDAARMSLDVPVIGAANHLLVWLAVHQLGFAWRDGRLRTDFRSTGPMVVVGLGVLTALTVFGPYPISMVGVPGAEFQNTAPPTLALLALALTQTGIALSLDRAGNRWLRRMRPWTVVVGMNAVVLTVFLWHMAAAVVAAAALYPTGIFPQPPVGSAAWILWRLPWLACSALVLTVFVAVLGRIEQRTGPSGTGHGIDADSGNVKTRLRAWAWRALTVGGSASVLGGFIGIALAGQGYHGPGGLPTGALAAYLLGAAVLRITRRRMRGRR
ncbi:acyltransferase family protein [Spinactinospora alkalitolerans]